jgi:type IV secretory pathway VirB10-like protein
VPELPRAVHGTRHRRPELPRRVAQVPPPRAVARKRRRTTVTIGRSLVLRSPQLRLGAGTSATSAHDNREVTVGHALYIPIVATAPQNDERSSSSRSASASGASRPPRMAHRLVAGLARRRSTKVTWPRENGPRVSVPRASPQGHPHWRL